MKQMTPDDILLCLEADEAKSRPYRVQRMEILLDRFGNCGYMQFFGGIISAQAFEEMRLAYLNGLYISCVVVSQIIIEHLLSGMFSMMGREDLEGAGFQKLINEALAAEFLSQKEFEDLDHLRRLRNPYTHSKPMMHQSCFVRRAAESNLHPFELFKQDAETALDIVSGLLLRYPFSLSNEAAEEY